MTHSLFPTPLGPRISTPIPMTSTNEPNSWCSDRASGRVIVESNGPPRPFLELGVFLFDRTEDFVEISGAKELFAKTRVAEEA